MSDAPAGAPRLILERSGGFGGLTMRAEASGDELSADELAALQRALAAPARSAPPGPDRFQYDLTLVDGRRRRHVTLHEGAVPDALKPLLKRLMGRALPS